MSIANAVAVNTTLAYLDLSWNGFGEGPGIRLSEILASNSRLKKLSVSNCRLTSHVALVLSDSLRFNSTLTYLDMANNPLGTPLCACVCVWVCVFVCACVGLCVDSLVSVLWTLCVYLCVCAYVLTCVHTLAGAQARTAWRVSSPPCQCTTRLRSTPSQAQGWTCPPPPLPHCTTASTPQIQMATTTSTSR